MIMGWDNCQNKATFTMSKSGKYVFEFIDNNKNGYQFTGMKDRQIDNTSLYSNIDTIETTIDGKKVVTPNQSGGCTTKITPSGEKFVYIECAVTNSKRSVFKFKFSDITDVQRTIMPVTTTTANAVRLLFKQDDLQHCGGSSTGATPPQVINIMDGLREFRPRANHRRSNSV